MTPLRTRRLILRAPHREDAPAIAHYLNDFAVAGNLARVPFPYRFEDAQAWLRTRKPGLPPDEITFAIDWDGAYIGQIGFHPGPDGPIIGYWLGQPFWGRGFMSEAASAAIEWFFAHSAAPILHSGVFHFNVASLAIQHKLGFAETGRSSLLCLARNAEVEHIDTQLSQSAWKARKP